MVERDIIGYGASATNGFAIVDTVDSTLPYTNVDANTVQFAYAIGYKENDVIHGTNNGCYLSGGSGNDILIGGNGNDVLIGGLGNDDPDRRQGRGHLRAVQRAGRLGRHRHHP